jgi:adenosylcobinamide-phosphate synthase
MSFIAAALALLIENLVGYPRALQDRIRHPVQWIGDLISHYDRLLNTKSDDPVKGRTEGVIALGIVILAAAVPTVILQWLIMQLPYGWVGIAIIATPFLAQKSMRDHVEAVRQALGLSLASGRNEVAKIVGRDPSTLDESGVSKAALESLAENTSDGIVAPAFWLAVAGLPGIAIYKVINTADSMIGHRNETYQHFGWAAAKLDDLVNLPASRLTALLFAGITWAQDRVAGKRAWNVTWRDAPKHNSPNAGWPEAAMAGALDFSFGGPRNYDGEIVDLPHMGDGRAEFTREDIATGLQLFDKTVVVLAGLFALVGIVISTPWASLLP